jgi:protein TonB
MTIAAAGFDLHDGSGVRRWGLSLLLVLGLHAIAALLLTPRQRPIEPSMAPPAAVMIDLAPLPPATPPQPQARQPEPLPPPPVPEPPPPEPEPPPQPELALPPPEPVPPPHPAVTLPRPPPKPKHPPKPKPRPVEHAPPQMAAPPPLPPPAAAPRSAPAAPSSAAATSARANWQAQLMAWLSRHKRYPRPAQEQRQQGTAYLRFSLDRGGRVLAARLERSSGFPLLDEEVLALVHRAQPLPPPPVEVAGDRFELVVPVAFSIQR